MAKNLPMPLERLTTRRLNLRPLHTDDLPVVHAYMSDPNVTAWLPEGQLTEAQTHDFLARNAGEDAGAFALIHAVDNTLIGHMIFHPWFSHRTYEIGWVLQSQAHSRGYATEAASALLRYGFERLRLHRIVATCQPQNVPSYRVMEKLGMRREGHFRQCIFRGGDLWWDEYFYAILSTEWDQANDSS